MECYWCKKRILDAKELGKLISSVDENGNRSSYDLCKVCEDYLLNLIKRTVTFPTEQPLGRTSKQMKEAPIGSTFIWCNNNLMYPKHLARSLDRGDLKIISPPGDLARFCQGRKEGMIVIDHAYWMRH